MGNKYPMTLHVLSAAVVKLGKIVPAVTVYRAPGGALPKSFWKRSAKGTQGGLEAAFMSTTTAKDEALKYARRAPGKVLFEIKQGMVAHGASIAWLSQYPSEEEILVLHARSNATAFPLCCERSLWRDLAASLCSLSVSVSVCEVSRAASLCLHSSRL